MNEIDSLVCAEFKRLDEKKSMPRKKTSKQAAFRAAIFITIVFKYFIW
jgi:hypothetical protein